MRNVGMILLSFVAALVFVGCSNAGGGDAPKPSGEKESASQPSASADKTPNAEKLGHPTLGDADAPVVMTEYSDYQ